MYGQHVVVLSPVYLYKRYFRKKLSEMFLERRNPKKSLLPLYPTKYLLFCLLILFYDTLNFNLILIPTTSIFGLHSWLSISQCIQIALLIKYCNCKVHVVKRFYGNLALDKNVIRSALMPGNLCCKSFLGAYAKSSSSLTNGIIKAKGLVHGK